MWQVLPRNKTYLSTLLAFAIIDDCMSSTPQVWCIMEYSYSTLYSEPPIKAHVTTVMVMGMQVAIHIAPFLFRTCFVTTHFILHTRFCQTSVHSVDKITKWVYNVSTRQILCVCNLTWELFQITIRFNFTLDGLTAVLFCL